MKKNLRSNSSNRSSSSSRSNKLRRIFLVALNALFCFQPEVLQLLLRNKTVAIQSSGLVVGTDHFLELAGGQGHPVGDTRRQSLGEQPWRQPIILGLPSFALIEESFSYLNPLADSTQLVGGKFPAGHFVQKLRRFAIKIREALAQKFADDQGIQYRGEVLGCRY